MHLNQPKVYKDNPEVVQWHAEMGISGLQYTTGIKTLALLQNTFVNLGTRLRSTGDNISCSLQFLSKPDQKDGKFVDSFF